MNLWQLLSLPFSAVFCLVPYAPLALSTSSWRCDEDPTHNTIKLRVGSWTFLDQRQVLLFQCLIWSRRNTLTCGEIPNLRCMATPHVAYNNVKSQNPVTHSRSRSSVQHGAACITCRRRGRKCDKTLPACGRCISSGGLCEGYLLRWSETISSEPTMRQQSHLLLSHTRKTRQLCASQEPFVVLDASPPEEKESPTSHGDASPQKVSPASSWQELSITYDDHCAPADIDSAAAIALLTDSTKGYDIDPCSVPDGLGHLVNYGMLNAQQFMVLRADTRHRG